MTIRINNHKNCDVVCYSLPLLDGEIAGVVDGEMSVYNETSDSDHITWPVINGFFKVLVNLIPGNNIIILCCDSRKTKFSLTYEPLCTKKFLRLVYIVCKDDSGSFQSSPDEINSIQSAQCRISLAAQMLQTFTADKIKDHRLETRTFCLEEENDIPICHVFKSSLCLEKALTMTENELWEYFALELMRSDLRKGDDCKFLAVMSFTRYINDSFVEPKSFKESKLMLKGYAALAAGGLALLGSACLHTWPQSISEIPWRFGDSRKVDRLKLLDDSCNRGWYWACYATSLGATLHELGHVFDLGHTKDGIMSRGFDNIHRFFIVDLFYCSRTYQKNHNPHYQKSCQEKKDNIQLCQKSSVSWAASKPVSNIRLGSVRHENEVCKMNCKSSSSKQSSNKSRPPWRSPYPPDFNSYESCSSDAFWARSSALILYYHKWFKSESNVVESGNVSRNGTKFMSPHGIRVVEYRDDDGTAFYHLEFTSESNSQEVDVQISPKHTDIPETTNINVHVQDSEGNIYQHSFTKFALVKTDI